MKDSNHFNQHPVSSYTMQVGISMTLTEPFTKH